MSESNRGNLKRRARSLSPERPSKRRERPSERPSEEKGVSAETLVDFVVSQAYKKIEGKLQPPIHPMPRLQYPQAQYIQYPQPYPSYPSYSPQYPQHEAQYPIQFSHNLQQPIPNSNIPCRFHGNCKRYCTFYHSPDENRIRFLRQTRVDFRIKKAFCSYIFQGMCEKSRDACSWAHDRRDICCSKCGHVGHSEFECMTM